MAGIGEEKNVFFVLFLLLLLLFFVFFFLFLVFFVFLVCVLFLVCFVMFVDYCFWFVCLCLFGCGTKAIFLQKVRIFLLLLAFLVILCVDPFLGAFYFYFFWGGASGRQIQVLFAYSH